MKILLTGGNGFIGSHILDLLRKEHDDIHLLLRKTSNTDYIGQHLQHVTIHRGNLTETESLESAVHGAECIIHCAGKTKALDSAEYYRVNGGGTSHLIQAANLHAHRGCHFIHISSRAVLPPATADEPVKEDETPDPISEYGRSKMMAENAVTDECGLPWTILRPAAVYGPRDTDFLGAFRAIQWHLLPLFNGGKQDISLVYGPDVAAAVRRCLGDARCHGKTYNVASPSILCIREFMRMIKGEMDTWAIPLYLPGVALYPVCLLQEMISKLSGTPSILNLQKYAELTAPGWACSVTGMRDDLDFRCPTDIQTGVRETLKWYRWNDWL